MELSIRLNYCKTVDLINFALCDVQFCVCFQKNMCGDKICIQFLACMERLTEAQG